MNLRALSLCAVLCAASACVQATTRDGAEPADVRAQRQVLVMLRLPPMHYTPDGRYVGNYSNAPGRVMRRRVAAELARDHGLALRDEWPMPVLGVDCFVLEAPDHAVAVRETQSLAGDPRVESAQAMQVFHALAAPARYAADPLYAAQPTAAAWHLQDLHAQATGKGVRVAVIDSGVAIDHPDLRGQVALSRNFVDQRRDVAEAHGTEVAGIIAARQGNGVGIAGVAPDARLLALRACWQAGAAPAACSSFTLAQALQFSIDARAQVLNLSLSGPSDRLLSRLLDAALAQGISVVGAVDVHARDGGFPASHRGVLAVAADEAVPLAVAAVQAPGLGIPAPQPDGGWGLVSGSSFAAAQVSGLVALLRQRNPRLTPSQLITALAPTQAVPSATVRPRAIDACAVMLRTGGHCACACATASAREATSHP
jgi:subtilisin family serine protease